MRTDYLFLTPGHHAILMPGANHREEAKELLPLGEQQAQARRVALGSRNFGLVLSASPAPHCAKTAEIVAGLSNRSNVRGVAALGIDQKTDAGGHIAAMLREMPKGPPLRYLDDSRSGWLSEQASQAWKDISALIARENATSVLVVAPAIMLAGVLCWIDNPTSAEQHLGECQGFKFSMDSETKTTSGITWILDDPLADKA